MATQVSSALANFEKTISKNNEVGVSSGMYLTSIASGKPKTTQLRTSSHKPTNTRMSMTAKVSCMSSNHSKECELRRQDSEFSLDSFSERSNNKKNCADFSFSGGSFDKGDDDDDDESVTFKDDDDWDFDDEGWDGNVSRLNTNRRSQKSMSGIDEDDCFAVTYSHKDGKSDSSLRSFSDHNDPTEWCRATSTSKIALASDEDDGIERKQHRRRGGRGRGDSREQHSQSSLSKCSDDEYDMKETQLHYHQSQGSCGSTRSDYDWEALAKKCKNTSDEDEVKPPQFSRAQSDRPRRTTTRSTSPSRRGYRASEGRRQLRRTNSSDEHASRAARRCGRRKPRNDDDSASTNSLSNESMHRNELKNYLVKENSRTSFSSLHDSKTSLDTQESHKSGRSLLDDDSETMGFSIPEENRPPTSNSRRNCELRRSNSEESLDRRCSRRPARRSKAHT